MDALKKIVFGSTHWWHTQMHRKCMAEFERVFHKDIWYGLHVEFILTCISVYFNGSAYEWEALWTIGFKQTLIATRSIPFILWVLVSMFVACQLIFVCLWNLTNVLAYYIEHRCSSYNFEVVGVAAGDRPWNNSKWHLAFQRSEVIMLDKSTYDTLKQNNALYASIHDKYFVVIDLDASLCKKTKKWNTDKTSVHTNIKDAFEFLGSQQRTSIAVVDAYITSVILSSNVARTVRVINTNEEIHHCKKCEDSGH